MSFEKEFEVAKIMLLFDKTIEKIKQMKSDLEVVDIPEFCKPKEERFETIEENRIREIVNANKLEYYYQEALKVIA